MDHTRKGSNIVCPFSQSGPVESIFRSEDGDAFEGIKRERVRINFTSRQRPPFARLDLSLRGLRGILDLVVPVLGTIASEQFVFSQNSTLHTRFPLF